MNAALHRSYAWWSPAQFYPQTGTLAYSDNHFGTFLFYSAFRAVGFSIEGAFQCWQILITGANTVAVYFLLRTLSVKPLLRGPLAFAGVSSFAFVSKLGHPQELPLFAFLFALAYLVRFLRFHDLNSLAAGLLWYAYLHYCYLYYGYFATFILAGIAILLLLLGANWWTPLRRAPPLAPRAFARLCGAAIGAASAVALLYAPYWLFVRARGWTNPLEILKELSPNVAAWFTPQYASTFYRHFYDTAAALPNYEKSLFAGFLFPILLILGLVVGCWYRHTLQGKILLAFNLTTLGIFALISDFPGTNWSIYLLAVEHIAPARAFRAFGRFANLLYPLQASAAGMCLTLLSRHTKARRKQVAVLGIALLLSIESLGTRQADFSYAKADAQNRAAVIATRLAGPNQQRPFAIVLENKPSGSSEVMHLDAFQAALLTRRSSVNGYSGSAPESHWQFLADPELSTLNRLLLGKRLPSRSVDVYTLSAGGRLLSRVIQLPDRLGGEYTWGENIIFKQGGRSSEFVLSGFTEEGGDWRWTLGKRSTLEFSVPPTLEDILLRFKAIPLIGGTVKSQIVNVVANDQKVATFQMKRAAGQEYEATIPAACLKGHDRVDLTFEVPHATSAASLGINRDERIMGIAFHDLQLQLLPNGLNAAQYSWGEKILFQKGGRSGEFVHSGFVNEGGEWRWTQGTKSTLEFSISSTSQTKVLSVEAIPLVGAGLSSQTVRVTVNGQLLGGWEMKNAWATEYTLDIPASVLKDRRILHLMFEVPKATSAASLKINSDQRILGIAIRSLRMD